MQDASGKLVRVPDIIVPADRGIIIRNTDQYTFERSLGGIYLPGGEEEFGDKKYRLGEVVSVGGNVNRDEVDIGDILVCLQQTAYRMPNANASTALWKVQHMDMSTMGVLPNLIEERRNPRWSAPMTTVVFNGTPKALGDILRQLKEWEGKYLLTLVRMGYWGKGDSDWDAVIDSGSMTRGERARFAVACAALDRGESTITCRFEVPNFDELLKNEIEQWQSRTEHA